jgi:sodium/potassium-transporting ATPase subunit alpha
MGEIATAGGFFTYFLTMQLYGFPSNIIFSLLSVPAINPVNNVTDNSANTNINTPYTYNETAPSFGSPNIPLLAASATMNTNFPDWISTLNNQMDLRGFYQSKSCGSGFTMNQYGYCPVFTWPTSDQVLHTKSTITNLEIVYTTESIFYAQSGYFVTIVLVQWSNVFACKSRKVMLFVFRSRLLSRGSTNTCWGEFCWRLSSSSSCCTCRESTMFLEAGRSPFSCSVYLGSVSR